MRVLLQRVTKSSVAVAGEVIGASGAGLLLLVGFGQGDEESKLKPAAEKVLNLRIFSDAQGKFNHSALEVGADILAVSQFTLYADTARGRRPGFSTALEPDKAEELFKLFVSELKGHGAKRVETGEFGAHMVVSLENDGPVTILLES